jgi:hypothetical protein
MGKKSAHTGMSPKDRSINLMDKFITRNQNKNKDLPFRSAIRKDPNIPIDQWPLKDQIEYWDNRTDSDRFDTAYPIYSYWIEAVSKASKVHSTFFADCISKLKPELKEMYETKTPVNEAVAILRKYGVY